MEYDKIAFAIKLCGNPPKDGKCKACPYFADGDMSKCIPTMTKDAFAAIIYLMVENQSLRNAANEFKAMAENAINDIYSVRRCTICAHHTGSWNARCESCDRDRNDFRPDFKWCREAVDNQ